jgi:hypothetical protein
MTVGEINEIENDLKKPKRTIYGKNLIEKGQDLSDAANLLTKSDILKGKDNRKTVFLDHYEKEVLIRPLSDGELTEVFELFGNVPLNDDGLPDLSLVDISKNLKALRLVTFKGLIDPKLNEDEIAQMRFGIPGLLAREILEFSGLAEGVGENNDMKKFRDEP